MKFAVTINEYPKHIVHANNALGAIKKTLDVLAEDGEVGNDLTITTKGIPPKAAPVKPVEKGHVEEGVVG